MSVCTTVVSTRSFAPSSNPSSTAARTTKVVDCFQRLWRQTDEAAVEGIVFGTGAQ